MRGLTERVKAPAAVAAELERLAEAVADPSLETHLVGVARDLWGARKGAGAAVTKNAKALVPGGVAESRSTL